MQTKSLISFSVYRRNNQNKHINKNIVGEYAANDIKSE